MKTAMQEIIEAWYSPDKIDNFDAWLGNNETRLLEKEKEQIIEAHNNAVISPYTELYIHKIQGKSPLTKGEEYYNKRYNQNN